MSENSLSNRTRDLPTFYFEGNAPPDNGTAFTNTPATVYYHADAPNRLGTDFGSRPTVAIGALHATARWRHKCANQFVRIHDHSRRRTSWSRLMLQRISPDSNSWIILGTNTLSGGPYQFTDPQWTNSLALLSVAHTLRQNLFSPPGRVKEAAIPAEPGKKTLALRS